MAALTYAEFIAVYPSTGMSSTQIDAFIAVAQADLERFIGRVLDTATFTQTDAVDGTATQTNRLLAVQTKQMNLQSMLQGRDTVNASKANVRAGLRDAVISLPTGAAGASLSAGGAGGATVLAALTRSATLGEKIPAGAPAQTGPTTATLLQHEGPILYQEVVAAMGW